MPTSHDLALEVAFARERANDGEGPTVFPSVVSSNQASSMHCIVLQLLPTKIVSQVILIVSLHLYVCR